MKPKFIFIFALVAGLLVQEHHARDTFDDDELTPNLMYDLHRRLLTPDGGDPAAKRPKQLGQISQLLFQENMDKNAEFDPNFWNGPEAQAYSASPPNLGVTGYYSSHKSNNGITTTKPNNIQIPQNNDELLSASSFNIGSMYDNDHDPRVVSKYNSLQSQQQHPSRRSLHSQLIQNPHLITHPGNSATSEKQSRSLLIPSSLRKSGYPPMTTNRGDSTMRPNGPTGYSSGFPNYNPMYNWNMGINQQQSFYPVSTPYPRILPEDCQPSNVPSNYGVIQRTTQPPINIGSTRIPVLVPRPTNTVSPPYPGIGSSLYPPSMGSNVNIGNPRIPVLVPRPMNPVNPPNMGIGSNLYPPSMGPNINIGSPRIPVLVPRPINTVSPPYPGIGSSLYPPSMRPNVNIGSPRIPVIVPRPAYPGIGSSLYPPSMGSNVNMGSPRIPLSYPRPGYPGIGSSLYPPSMGSNVNIGSPRIPVLVPRPAYPGIGSSLYPPNMGSNVNVGGPRIPVLVPRPVYPGIGSSLYPPSMGSNVPMIPNQQVIPYDKILPGLLAMYCETQGVPPNFGLTKPPSWGISQRPPGFGTSGFYPPIMGSNIQTFPSRQMLPFDKILSGLLNMYCYNQGLPSKYGQIQRPIKPQFGMLSSIGRPPPSLGIAQQPPSLGIVQQPPNLYPPQRPMNIIEDCDEEPNFPPNYLPIQPQFRPSWFGKPPIRPTPGTPWIINSNRPEPTYPGIFEHRLPTAPFLAPRIIPTIQPPSYLQSQPPLIECDEEPGFSPTFRPLPPQIGTPWVGKPPIRPTPGTPWIINPNRPGPTYPSIFGTQPPPIQFQPTGIFTTQQPPRYLQPQQPPSYLQPQQPLNLYEDCDEEPDFLPNFRPIPPQFGPSWLGNPPIRPTPGTPWIINPNRPLQSGPPYPGIFGHRLPPMLLQPPRIFPTIQPPSYLQSQPPLIECDDEPDFLPTFRPLPKQIGTPWVGKPPIRPTPGTPWIINPNRPGPTYPSIFGTQPPPIQFQPTGIFTTQQPPSYLQPQRPLNLYEECDEEPSFPPNFRPLPPQIGSPWVGKLPIRPTPGTPLIINTNRPLQPGPTYPGIFGHRLPPMLLQPPRIYPTLQPPTFLQPQVPLSLQVECDEEPGFSPTFRPLPPQIGLPLVGKPTVRPTGLGTPWLITRPGPPIGGQLPPMQMVPPNIYPSQRTPTLHVICDDEPGFPPNLRPIPPQIGTSWVGKPPIRAPWIINPNRPLQTGPQLIGNPSIRPPWTMNSFRPLKPGPIIERQPPTMLIGPTNPPQQLLNYLKPQRPVNLYVDYDEGPGFPRNFRPISPQIGPSWIGKPPVRPGLTYPGINGKPPPTMGMFQQPNLYPTQRPLNLYVDCDEEPGFAPNFRPTQPWFGKPPIRPTPGTPWIINPIRPSSPGPMYPGTIPPPVGIVPSQGPPGLIDCDDEPGFQTFNSFPPQSGIPWTTTRPPSTGIGQVPSRFPPWSPPNIRQLPSQPPNNKLPITGSLGIYCDDDLGVPVISSSYQTHLLPQFYSQSIRNPFSNTQPGNTFTPVPTPYNGNTLMSSLNPTGINQARYVPGQQRSYQSQPQPQYGEWAVPGQPQQRRAMLPSQTQTNDMYPYMGQLDQSYPTQRYPDFDISSARRYSMTPNVMKKPLMEKPHPYDVSKSNMGQAGYGRYTGYNGMRPARDNSMQEGMHSVEFLDGQGQHGVNTMRPIRDTTVNPDIHNPELINRRSADYRKINRPTRQTTMKPNMFSTGYGSEEHSGYNTMRPTRHNADQDTTMKPTYTPYTMVRPSTRYSSMETSKEREITPYQASRKIMQYPYQDSTMNPGFSQYPVTGQYSYATNTMVRPTYNGHYPYLNPLLQSTNGYYRSNNPSYYPPYYPPRNEFKNFAESIINCLLLKRPMPVPYSTTISSSYPFTGGKIMAQTELYKYGPNGFQNNLY